MRRILFITSLLVGAIACTDNNDTTEEQSNFYALTVGNSWEYKYYKKDNTTNNFDPTPIVESVNITHTETINNEVYYNFKHVVSGNNGDYTTLPSDGEYNLKFRDSLGYLIDHVGSIKYANNNYNEHFVDHLSTDWSYYLQLSNVQDMITTNAGDFSCLDNHYYLKDINNNVSNGLEHLYREDGKGQILGTITFASQSEHFAEKRLETYTVQ